MWNEVTGEFKKSGLAKPEGQEDVTMWRREKEDPPWLAKDTKRGASGQPKIEV